MKIIIPFLIIFPLYSSGQMKICVTQDRSKAEVLVYKTKFFSEASLVVKKSWSIQDLNKPFHWYFVSNNLASSADWIVYYVDSFEEADVTVHFTENPKLLGQFSACDKIHPVFEYEKNYRTNGKRKK